MSKKSIKITIDGEEHTFSGNDIKIDILEKEESFHGKLEEGKYVMETDGYISCKNGGGNLVDKGDSFYCEGGRSIRFTIHRGMDWDGKFYDFGYISGEFSKV